MFYFYVVEGVVQYLFLNFVLHIILLYMFVLYIFFCLSISRIFVILYSIMILLDIIEFH